MNDGHVLITGGYGSTGVRASAELYDPSTNTWSAVPDMGAARYNHAATLLTNGKVLVTGGRQDGAFASAEIYDPATRSLVAGRIHAALALQPHGDTT